MSVFAPKKLPFKGTTLLNCHNLLSQPNRANERSEKSDICFDRFWKVIFGELSKKP